MSTLPRDPSHATVRLGAKGRVVIPAELRRAAGFEQGEILVARARAGKLVLERREAVLSRLRARFSGLPPGVSLADELIAERRAEAADGVIVVR
ncbi:AbrB/MazE/SpoVT family DNA-binding domain-containing protein [Myxococcota bacterium]|nr:AbrB/MazE/SpoVT family DNA-binding domain-containing protein [Myxococcota bacterium]